MVDFRKKLSQKQIRLLHATTVEIHRLFALQDRWLGQALLHLARDVRAEFSGRLSDPSEQTYDATFVWSLVPEIARRLGAEGVSPDEIRRTEIRYATDRELRELTGIFLNNLSIGQWSLENRDIRDRPSSADLLTREFVNGNPVAFAIDRICPPAPVGADKDDWLARHVREVAAHRGGDDTGEWSPSERDLAYWSAEISDTHDIVTPPADVVAFRR